MSARLDWEIDDVDTPLPDAAQPAQNTPPGCRRWWRLFALAALVTGIGLGFLGIKLRQKQQELENELLAVVELELNAFSDGDRDLFLSLQDPADRRWQRAQEEAFDDYHWLAVRAPWQERPLARTYTGEVPALHVQETANKGWARVEVTRGERNWQELWFYRWTAADGWRRTRFDSDWLGEDQALITSHLHFTYPQRDAAIVNALAHEMEAWYDILAPLLGVRPTGATLLTVRFAYRATNSTSPEPRWIATTSTLEASSPHQGPLAADDTPSPELRALMAHYLVEALISHQSEQQPTTRLGPTISALRAELRDWAVSHLVSLRPEPIAAEIVPSPLIDALVDRDGVQVLPTLAANLHPSQTLDQTLTSAGLDLPGTATRMAFHVAAVNRAFHAFDESSYQDLLHPRASRAWRQDKINTLRSWRSDAQNDVLWPKPSSLEVTSVVFNSPTAWVEARTRMSDGAVFNQVYFFRQWDDQWLLTAPDPTFLGERRVTRTENLLFNYFERDAALLEEELPDRLQTVLGQAAADLGISTERLVITIETEIPPGVDLQPVQETFSLRFPSPSIAGWRVDQPDRRELQLAIDVLGTLFETRMQFAPTQDDRYIIGHIGAFIWELERLFPEQIDWDAVLGFNIDRVPALSLTELWETATLDVTERDFVEVYAGFRALFSFLTETYGSQIVPDLLDNLSQTDDIDRWLWLSTGHRLDEIEPNWKAWLSENYQKK